MPEAAVRTLHEPPVEKVVASAVEIVVGVANDRQMRFSTAFEGDETDAAINARFDRIFRLADRQKARYEIDDLDLDLSKTRDTLSQFREDMGRIEADHERAQAARGVEMAELENLRAEKRDEFIAEINATILKMQEQRAETERNAIEDHNRSGARGSFVARGHVKTTLERIDTTIKKAGENREEALAGFERDYDDLLARMRGEFERAQAERDQSVANLNISITRYEEAIVEKEARLEKCRAKLEG